MTPRRRWPRSTGPSHAPRRSRRSRSSPTTFAPFPKATAKITGDLDVLLAFFDFPLEHWIHLRTTNPIESTFSTVRLRTKVTRGAGSRKAGLAMAYKLLDAAQDRWRRINGHELVPLVRAGATFIDGKLQERSAREHRNQREHRVRRRLIEKSHPQLLTMTPEPQWAAAEYFRPSNSNPSRGSSSECRKRSP